MSRPQGSTPGATAGLRGGRMDHPHWPTSYGRHHAAAGNAVFPHGACLLARQPARLPTLRAARRFAAQLELRLTQAELACLARVDATRHRRAWVTPLGIGRRRQGALVHAPLTAVEPHPVVAARGELAAAKAIATVGRERAAI